jgi:archaemetzincin
VGPVDNTLLPVLKADLQKHLNLPVDVLGNMPVPEGSYERSRNQYHSTKILKEILAEVPPDAMKILGLIDKDLCIPILTFVFGEAQLDGMASVVGFARLRQDFYGLPADRDIFYERIRKECLHELGHNFGLTHCPDRECVMYLSNTVRDVDQKGITYCQDCDSTISRKIESGRV